jgi:hypothetical protein
LFGSGISTLLGFPILPNNNDPIRMIKREYDVSDPQIYTLTDEIFALRPEDGQGRHDTNED